MYVPVKLMFILIGCAIALQWFPRSCIGDTLSGHPVLTRPLVLEIAAKSVALEKSADNGIDYFKLHCGLGACSLEKISLNYCERLRSGEIGFVPVTQTWSTWAGSLMVLHVSDNEIDILVYQGSGKQLPAKLVFNYTNKYGRDVVTGFFAESFIDPRIFPGLLNKVSYQPLEGSQQLISLHCPVVLPGVERD